MVSGRPLNDSVSVLHSKVTCDTGMSASFDIHATFTCSLIVCELSMWPFLSKLKSIVLSGPMEVTQDVVLHVVATSSVPAIVESVPPNSDSIVEAP
jgi:hypothetical protein